MDAEMMETIRANARYYRTSRHIRQSMRPG